MGLLQDGQWVDQWYDTKANKGAFKRQESAFRHWITADGSAGPSGVGGFGAESGRYHLYVSLACPWAHRTLIMRELKDLSAHISVSIVEPLMLENGWAFSDDYKDHLFGHSYLYQVYQRADASYSGRVTVPVLWDKSRNTIVSNESSEIMRMLNSAFNEITGNTLDFYPTAMRVEIDRVNDIVYDGFNNGVYRAGFATSQEAYESAYGDVFNTLDWLEERLGQQRYVVGDQITEADWRLFTTLIRFDSVYFGHFKCNQRLIRDYPNILGYLRELFQMPGISESVNMRYIKAHYYGSHGTINPTGVIPLGQEDTDYLLEADGRDETSFVLEKSA